MSGNRRHWTSGSHLFKSLLNVYPRAHKEDYRIDGVWQRDILQIDLELIRTHRKNAEETRGLPRALVPQAARAWRHQRLLRPKAKAKPKAKSRLAKSKAKSRLARPAPSSIGGGLTPSSLGSGGSKSPPVIGARPRPRVVANRGGGAPSGTGGGLSPSARGSGDGRASSSSSGLDRGRPPVIGARPPVIGAGPPVIDARAATCVVAERDGGGLSPSAAAAAIGGGLSASAAAAAQLQARGRGTATGPDKAGEAGAAQE